MAKVLSTQQVSRVLDTLDGVIAHLCDTVAACATRVVPASLASRCCSATDLARFLRHIARRVGLSCDDLALMWLLFHRFARSPVFVGARPLPLHRIMLYSAYFAQAWLYDEPIGRATWFNLTQQSWPTLMQGLLEHLATLDYDTGFCQAEYDASFQGMVQASGLSYANAYVGRVLATLSDTLHQDDASIVPGGVGAVEEATPVHQGHRGGYGFVDHNQEQNRHPGLNSWIDITEDSADDAASALILPHQQGYGHTARTVSIKLVQSWVKTDRTAAAQLQRRLMMQSSEMQSQEPLPGVLASSRRNPHRRSRGLRHRRARGAAAPGSASDLYRGDGHRARMLLRNRALRQYA